MFNLMHFDQIPHNAIFGTYDPLYIFLSYVISSITALIAIMILEVITLHRNSVTRIKACLLGSSIMGIGFWSLHLSGLFAVQLNFERNFLKIYMFLSLL